MRKVLGDTPDFFPINSAALLLLLGPSALVMISQESLNSIAIGSLPS